MFEDKPRSSNILNFNVTSNCPPPPPNPSPVRVKMLLANGFISSPIKEAIQFLIMVLKVYLKIVLVYAIDNLVLAEELFAKAL